MSSIIKSFRVVERSIISNEDIDTNTTPLDDKLLGEAREKYEEIIRNAKEEAKIIINSAHGESEEKLNLAYERAKEISEEARAEGYKKGYEAGHEQGYKEGYEIGYKEGKEASEKLIREALDIKNSYIEQRSKLLKEAEEDLIDLVISIYEKVLYKNVEKDEEIIVNLVLNGIDNLEISEKLTVIVSKDNYESVEKSKEIILAKASLIDELDIRINSDMKKGDCILETSKGSVDVSIDNQLDEVKDLLTTILSNE